MSYQKAPSGRMRGALLLGAIIGAATGGAAGFLIGAIAALTVVRIGGLLVILFLAAAGTGAGVVAGSLTALLVVHTTRWFSPPPVAAVCGSVCGILFGLFLQGPFGGVDPRHTTLIAPLVAGVIGAIGGWILGLGLRQWSQSAELPTEPAQ